MQGVRVVVVLLHVLRDTVGGFGQALSTWENFPDPPEINGTYIFNMSIPPCERQAPPKGRSPKETPRTNATVNIERHQESGFGQIRPYDT